MKTTFRLQTNPLPLHPAQEELTTGTSEHHSAVGGCLTLVGPLNYTALRRVIHHLPIMFDVFRWQFDPIQPIAHVVDLFRTPCLPLIDCSADASPRQTADTEAEHRMNAPFAEHQWFDLTLLRVYDTEHRLLLRGHRLLLDDIGFDCIVRYIAEAYSAVMTGGALPEPAPTYVEDAVSARLYPNSLAYLEGRAYWQKQFTEVPELLLCTGQRNQIPPPAYMLVGNHTLCRALEQASTVLNAPPTYLLLAALTICFARINQQPVCVFGRSVAGRQSKKQLTTVGRFDRALPIRLHYLPGQSVRLFVQAIRRQHRADNSHRHYPMSHVAGALATPDSPHPPLYDIFVKQLPAAPAPMVGDVLCKVERLVSFEADVPLQLLWQAGNAYQPAGLRVLCRPTSMSETDLHWLLGQVEQLLTEFARRPDAPIGQIGLIKPMHSTMATAYTPSRLSSQTARFADF